jgi:hypothetical protein
MNPNNVFQQALLEDIVFAPPLAKPDQVNANHSVPNTQMEHRTTIQ